MAAGGARWAAAGAGTAGSTAVRVPRWWWWWADGPAPVGLSVLRREAHSRLLGTTCWECAGWDKCRGGEVAERWWRRGGGEVVENSAGRRRA
jgi:hypothetical protein